MLFLRALLTLALGLWMQSCATGSLEIKSVPEQATVTAVDSTGKRTLGTTPLQIDTNRVFRSNSGYVRLIVEKSNMEPESVVLPQQLKGADHVMDFRLKPKATEAKMINTSGDTSQSAAQFESCQYEKREQSKIAKGVARAQSLIAKKSYPAARVHLDNMVSEYPHVSVLHLLLGNVAYATNDLNGAVNSYQEALRLDPTNIEAQRVVDALSPIQRAGDQP